MINRLAFSCLFLMSFSAHAESVNVSQMAGASSIWRLFLALGLLIALIPLVIWGLKRLQGLQYKLSKSDIRVVAAHPITAKERLLLVEVDGRRLLLGATSHQITCLKELGRTDSEFADLMTEQLSDEK